MIKDFLSMEETARRLYYWSTSIFKTKKLRLFQMGAILSEVQDGEKFEVLWSVYQNWTRLEPGALSR